MNICKEITDWGKYCHGNATLLLQLRSLKMHSCKKKKSGVKLGIANIQGVSKIMLQP